MSLIGIDIGSNNCKIAMREGSGMRLISARMPENMVSSGEVASPESMAKFLAEVRASEQLRERNCALVLGSSQIYFRHVTLPPMNISELQLNLPYEFRDFISGDPDEYVYDYAVDDMEYDEEGALVRMNLYIAAVPRSIVETYSTMLKKAGFRLKLVTPAPMAYTRLLSSQAAETDPDCDSVLVDIGYSGAKVVLFQGLRYDSMRTIDFGCQELDHIIADIKGIDPYTAGSYKFTNFEGVLDEPECLALCDRLAMEVAKVVNFYNFNNPEREIGRMYFLGGGACIDQITRAIGDAVSVPATRIDACLPEEVRGQDNSPVCALAIAGILEGESM